MGKSKGKLYVGACCGEAGDGVDVALVGLRGRGEAMTATVLDHTVRSLPDGLAEPLGRVLDGGTTEPVELASLDMALGAYMGQAAATLTAESVAADAPVEALGIVGPVVLRVSDRNALPTAAELGSPAAAAAQAELPTVGRLPESDGSAGGSGAAPTAWAKWRVLRDPRLSRVMVRLGGLARLTVVGADSLAGDVTAMDVGPGTALVDALAREHLDRPMDADGALAAKGQVCPELVHELLADRYFRRPAPRAATPGEWGAEYRERLALMAGKYACEGADLLASVVDMIARSVADAVTAGTERPHQVVLCGGGALNIHLAGRIRDLLSPSSTVTSDRFGVPVRACEAACVAMQAAARMDGYPAHCPAASGAQRRVVLGLLAAPA